MKFEELNLSEVVMEGLSAMNFQECTPIQEKAIPVILEGKDLLASAQTGTGKTAAYLLPLLHMLSTKRHPEQKVNAIIMSPTRELALQVDRLLEGFAYFTSTSAIAIYGGNDATAWSQQRTALELGGDIVIATPGRLISHLKVSNIDLSAVEYFILDEADRMLDIGFHEDIMEILSYLPKKRQTLMFSATFPPEVEKLAQKILNQPVEIKLAISKPAEKIRQGVYMVHAGQKIPLIEELFRQEQGGKKVIFASSKEKVKALYRSLAKMNLNVSQMHSDLTQEEREQVMLDFKNNKIHVLVATDIIARGIDIDDISMVINFDTPRQAEDYVHRIGRTARAGASGIGITLVCNDDYRFFSRIENFIGKKIERLPLPDHITQKGGEVEEKDWGKGPRERKESRSDKPTSLSKGKTSSVKKESGDQPKKPIVVKAPRIDHKKESTEHPDIPRPSKKTDKVITGDRPSSPAKKPVSGRPVRVIAPPKKIVRPQQEKIKKTSLWQKIKKAITGK